MEARNSQRWYVGVSSVALISIGATILMRVPGWDVRLTEALQQFSIRPWDLHGLGICTILAGGLLLKRETRNIGWGMAGCSLVVLLLAFVILDSAFSDGLVYKGRPLSITGILVVVILIAVTMAGVAALHGIAAAQETENRHGQIKALLAEKKELEARMSADADTRRGSDEEWQKKAAKQEKAIETAGILLAEEQTRHRETRYRRPYESQLVAAFTISLGVAWREQNPRVEFSLNYFQGNKDRDFGDFVGITEGSCWLIELKRNWESIGTELKKEARIAQSKALRSEPEMVKIAQKCHWIGWGKSTKTETHLWFSDYWNILQPHDESPIKTIDGHTFAQRTFSDQANSNIGENPERFARYMRFLADKAAGPDGASGDTIAALVFQRDAAGRVRYWIEPDLLEVARTIQNRYMQQEAIEIERKRAANRARAEESDLDHEHRSSPGFHVR